MGAALAPEEIYDQAEREGRRRLSMPPLEQVATGFVAGVTIIFGIVALAVTASLAEPALGRELAMLVGALAFGVGLVFLVVGRSELFSENFFDPVAAVIDDGRAAGWRGLVRLWVTMLVLNLVGGAVLVALLTVDGALPGRSGEVLVRVAEEIVSKPWSATLVRAVLAGALVALLSYMLAASQSTSARILVAFMVGFFLATGPFDHVVVSALHVLFGVWLADVTYGDLATNIALSATGNVIGGLLLVTLTHTAQVKSRRHQEGRD